MKEERTLSFSMSQMVSNQEIMDVTAAGGANGSVIVSYDPATGKTTTSLDS
jgi:hypothetical protein